MFLSPGLHGYSVKFSPFSPNKLAVVACQQYGIRGSSCLFVLDLPPNLNAPVRTSSTHQWHDGLFDVAWSETAENICVTASGDGSIQIWDTYKPKDPDRVLRGHEKEVYSVDWSHRSGNNLILTGSWDRTAKVWDPHKVDGAPVGTYSGHSGIVYSAVWSPLIEGTFATSSGDGTLRIWDTRKAYMPQNVIVAHEAEVLSCDWSKYDPNILVTASVDCSLKIWDLRNQRLAVRQHFGHGYAVRRVRFSPHDGAVLASCSYDFTVRTWNFMVPPSSNPLLEVIEHHTEFVYGLDFNLHIPGMLADCGWDSKTMVYKPKSITES